MSEVVSTAAQVGEFTGVLDVYVAKRKTEDTKEKVPTYDAPRVLGKGIEVTITPSYKEGELNASNVTTRRKRRVDRYTVKVNMADVKPENKNYVLGRAKDKNGVEILGGEATEDVEVAIGLCRTKDNGAKELWWLYRSQFSESEVSGKTETTGSIEYQTPTMEAVCLRRIHDNLLGMVVDSDDASVPESVISGWFGAVYEAEKEPQG